jgi:CBS-domain-containing membrane protein
MSGTIRDLMTTPVVTVRQNTPFKVIVSRMLAARVGAVPVIDDAGLVIGIVSAHDLLAR